MNKTIKAYWPVVKEMSQITLLLGIGFYAFIKALTSTDVEIQKMWGGVVIAAFLFSLIPMWVEMAKTKLPKSK